MKQKTRGPWRGPKRWMEHSWKRINDSRQMKRRRGGGPLQFNHHIFSLVRDIIYTNPLKGQEQSMRCQLYLSSQYFFFSSPLSFCLSLFRFVAVFVGLSPSSVSLWIPSFSSIFMGLTPITVDFMSVDACVCPCVLFKDRMSFNNLGFRSVRLAGSGVPLQFQRLTSPIFIMVKTERERGRKEKSTITAKVEWAWHWRRCRPGEGRIKDIKALY